MRTWQRATLAVCLASVWAHTGEATHERLAEHTLPGDDLVAYQYLTEEACVEHCNVYRGDEPCRAAVYLTVDQMCRLSSATRSDAVRVGLASAKHGYFVLSPASNQYAPELGPAAAPGAAPSDVANGTSVNPDAHAEAFNGDAYDGDAYATAESLAAGGLDYSDSTDSDDVDVWAATGQALAEAEAVAEGGGDIGALLDAVVDSVGEDAALLAAADAAAGSVEEWDSEKHESIEDRLADLNDLSDAEKAQYQDAALEILEELEGPGGRRSLLQAVTPFAGCVVETRGGLWTPGENLRGFGGILSDNACFDLCRQVPTCTLSIRSPGNGCFLRENKSKLDLVPSADLSSSYCRDAVPAFFNDCVAETRPRSWTPGDTLASFGGTISDSDCFDRCRANPDCSLSIRNGSGGCFLRRNKTPADLQLSNDLASTYCKSSLPNVCPTTTAAQKWAGGADIASYPGTANDADCFAKCAAFSGCKMSIRAPDGGCFLRREGPASLVSSQNLSTTYCTSDAVPATPVCATTTSPRQWVAGADIASYPGTLDDADCFAKCAAFPTCKLSVRAPNGGCFLRTQGPEALRASGDLASTYCTSDIPPPPDIEVCATTTSAGKWVSGKDIASYGGTSDNADCFRKCAAFPGCNLSIRNSGGGCFLRAEGPANLFDSPTLTSTYCTSSIPAPPPPPPACALTTSPGLFTTGNNLASFGGTTNDADCFAKCLATSGCVLSIRNSGGGCFLRTQGPQLLEPSPGLTSTYCTSSIPSCEITTASNRWVPGTDLFSFPGTSSDADCFSKCAAFKGCNLSVRSPDGGCFLRAEGPGSLMQSTTLSSTYCTSSVSTCPTTTSPGQWVPGNDLASFGGTASDADCFTKCATTAGCVTSIRSTAGGCFLRREGPAGLAGAPGLSATYCTSSLPVSKDLCGGGQCNNQLRCPVDTELNLPMRFSPNLIRFTDYRDQTLTVVVVPTGSGTIARVRCTQIGPLRAALSAFQVENKQCSEGGFRLSTPVTSGQPLLVSFNPGSFIGAVQGYLELLSDTGSVLGRVPLLGVAGNVFPEDGHSAHPVPKSNSVHIARPGQTSVNVNVFGGGSHCHSGCQLEVYRWTHLNTGTTRTDQTFDCVHQLGTHAYKLDVQDNLGTQAGDFLSFAVAPSNNIPGTLLEVLTPQGQPVFADMLTANSFEVNEALIMSSLSRIRMSGKVALTQGDKVTWFGCADTPTVSLNDVNLGQSGDGFTVPSSGVKNMKFTCNRAGRLTIVQVNGLPVEFPAVDIANSSPTLNRVDTALSTRPLARGTVSGFYLGTGTLRMYNAAETYALTILEQDAVSVSFTYPSPRAGGLFFLEFRSSSGATSNSVSVTVSELASQDPSYSQQSNLSPGIAEPAAAVYCHGKLYVANVGLRTAKGLGDWSSEGYIYEYELDANYNVRTWKLVTSVGRQLGGTSSRTILGMTCDPWDSSSKYKLYFSRSSIFAYRTTGNQINSPAQYSGTVSYVIPDDSTCVRTSSQEYSDNSNRCNLPNIQDVIRGLPVSNYDHAVNGLEFTHSGSLLVCVGSGSNAGVPSPSLRSMPESPLSGSILEFKLHSMPKPLDITYTFINNVPSQKIDSLQSRDPNDLRNGPWVKVSQNTQWFNVLYYGLRNPWDATVTVEGEIHFTVSGPNNGFGDKMRGVDSLGNLQNSAIGNFNGDIDMVVLNAPKSGCHGGHSNQAICNFQKFEGSGSTELCSWVQSDDTSLPNHCATKARSSSTTVFTLPSALGSVMEFSSQVFGGKVHQHRYMPAYKKWTNRCEKDRPQVCVVDTSGQASGTGKDNAYPSSPGLTLLALPGGAHCGVVYWDANPSRYRVYVNRPTNTPAGAQVWDIFPDRAPQTSSNRIRFEIGGKDFPANGMYATFGGSRRVELSLSDGRLRGVIPDSTVQGLVDVSVFQDNVGQIGVLPKMFYFLTTNPST